MGVLAGSFYRIGEGGGGSREGQVVTVNGPDWLNPLHGAGGGRRLAWSNGGEAQPA
jgi:hypothetical protein